MTTITDYSSLRTSVAEYLNREDLIDRVPTFIQLAEVEFNTRLRSREMIIRAEATSDNEYVSLPSNWLEAKKLKIVDGKAPLRYVTLDEAEQIVQERYYNTVIAYSLMNGAIELVPAPGSNVDIEMIYYSNIPSLSDSNTTNWLLTKAPDVYLYGALMHAQPFLMDDQRMPTFAALYNARLEALQYESDKAAHSGSPLVARVRRVY